MLILRIQDGTPYELLLMVWRNLNGFLRDPQLGLNADNSPKAYNLILSYRSPPLASSAINESKTKTIDDYPMFKRRGARGALVLDTMRITAGLTLGLMAWDKRDRATAALRYQEALALADKYADMLVTKPTRGLEGWLAVDVGQMRDNLAVLVLNDQVQATMVDGPTQRRQEVATADGGKANLQTWRVEGNGEVSLQTGHTFATDVCASCDKRGVKLFKCSRCQRITCKFERTFTRQRRNLTQELRLFPGMSACALAGPQGPMQGF